MSAIEVMPRGEISDELLLALYEGLSPEGKAVMYRLALEALERDSREDNS